jgi:hypothetical protein
MSGNRGKGRPKGAVNKATKDIKEIARAHGPEVIEGFWRLFKEADSDQAKIAAGKEILDRAYGKSTQPLSGDDDAPAIKVISELVLRGVRSDPRD